MKITPYPITTQTHKCRFRTMLCIIAFWCFSLGGYSQQFNIRLSPELGGVLHSVWEYGGNYFVAGTSADTTISGAVHFTLFTAKLDSSGNVLGIHNYGDSTQYLAFGYDANTQGNGSNKVIGTNYGTIPLEILYMEISESAEVLAEIVLELPVPEVEWTDIRATGMVDLPDGGFALSLPIFDYEYGQRYIIAKYNNNKQLEWSREFDVAPLGDLCFEITYFDRGIIVPGTGSLGETEGIQYFKALQFETGEEMWSIDFEHDWLRTCFGLEVDSSGIVSAGFYKDPDGLWADPAIYKIDFEGNLMWYFQVDFGYAYIQKFYNLVSCADESGYVAIGNHFEVLNPDSTGGDQYNERAVLVKISNDGELIWQREFVGLESLSDQHEVSDLKATDDGVYIFCGSSKDGDSNSPTFTPPAQQGWVVKVDACGCLVPGCDPNCNANPENPEPPVNADEPFLVGPNPATDFINVHILLEGEDQQRRIELFNYLGQQVRSYRIPQGSTTYMIDTRGLTPGTYVIRVSDGTGVLGTQKVEKMG